LKCISLKLEEEQLEKLKEMVRESGKNRSELIRNKIFNSDTSDTGGDTKFLMDFFEKFKNLFIKDKNALIFLEENKDRFTQIANSLGEE
jgi:hypothetical protein